MDNKNKNGRRKLKEERKGSKRSYESFSLQRDVKFLSYFLQSGLVVCICRITSTLHNH